MLSMRPTTLDKMVPKEEPLLQYKVEMAHPHQGQKVPKDVLH